MSGKTTPAVAAVRRTGMAHRLLEYDYNPDAGAIGLHAAEALGLDPATVFKTLIVNLDQKELVCAVVPVAARLDLKRLATAAGGRKAELADPGRAERVTGYVIGGISPLGPRKPLRTFVDASASSLEEMVVNGGRRGLQLALRPADLVGLLGAVVLDMVAA